MKHHKSINQRTHVYIITEFSSVVWLARHIIIHTHRTQGTQTHNRININMHAPGTVSYTHLDVYKRQAANMAVW